MIDAGRPVEFDCADCRRHVIGFDISDPAGPKRCMTCDWIRRNLPPEHHTAARERLGVPLDPSDPNAPA